MIPSLNSKPKRTIERKWLVKEGCVVCPACKSVYQTDDIRTFRKNHKFCSECGARLG